MKKQKCLLLYRSLYIDRLKDDTTFYLFAEGCIVEEMLCGPQHQVGEKKCLWIGMDAVKEHGYCCGAWMLLWGIDAAVGHRCCCGA